MGYFILTYLQKSLTHLVILHFPLSAFTCEPLGSKVRCTCCPGATCCRRLLLTSSSSRTDEQASKTRLWDFRPACAQQRRGARCGTAAPAPEPTTPLGGRRGPWHLATMCCALVLLLTACVMRQPMRGVMLIVWPCGLMDKAWSSEPKIAGSSPARVILLGMWLVGQG